MIISDERQFIWYLWATVNWKQHDYNILKNEFLGKNVFIETNLMLDLWFHGVVSKFWDTIKWILIPEKKPRKTKNNPNIDLTMEQKESNKVISSFRIKVENAIWWAKRFWAVTQIFRNKSEQFNDLVMELACSLWNFHLSF